MVSVHNSISVVLFGIKSLKALAKLRNGWLIELRVNERKLIEIENAESNGQFLR